MAWQIYNDNAAAVLRQLFYLFVLKHSFYRTTHNEYFLQETMPTSFALS